MDLRHRHLLLSLLPALVLAAPSTPSDATALDERSYSSWTPLASHGIMVPLSDREGISDRLPIILPTGNDLSSKSSDASIFNLKPFFSHIDITHSSASRYDYVDEWEPAVNPLWDHDLEDDLRSLATIWRRSHSGDSRDVRRRDGIVSLIPASASNSSVEQRSVVDEHQGDDKPRMVRRSSRRHRPHHGDRHSAKIEALAQLKARSEEKRSVKAGATISTTVTWYSGNDLRNPYCDRKSHWTPTDDSLVVAVTQLWEDRPACGEFLEVALQGHGGKPGKSVTVRVVDLCGGCRPGVAHADLSKSAFSALLDLDVGVKSGLLMRKVPPPQHWDESLYGPKVL